MFKMRNLQIHSFRRCALSLFPVLAILGLTLPGFISSVSATPVTYNYFGTTDDNPADPWSLTYTFESTAPAVLTPSENRADYPTAITALSLTVAGLSFSLDPTGGSDPVGSNIAINDNLTGLDIYSLRGVLQDANGFINPLVTLTFTSTSGTVFSSTDLPAFQPNPSQFEIIGLRVSATVNGQNQAQYRGDNAQIGIVAAVPAPGAVTIFCLGLAGLAMARRKRAIRPAL